MLPSLLPWQGTCVSVPPTTTGKRDERAPTCLSIAVLCRGKQDQDPEHPRNKTSCNTKSSITRRPAPSLGGTMGMEKLPINPPGRSQGVMAFGVGDRECDRGDEGTCGKPHKVSQPNWAQSTLCHVSIADGGPEGKKKV